MLKIDFHLHTNLDPSDYLTVRQTPEKLLRQLARQGFDVIAISHHNQVYFPPALLELANELELFLIPGAEMTIEGRHVLVMNVTQEEIANLHTFEALRKLRAERGNSILIIAPHPFFPGVGPLRIGLQEKLIANLDLFDAIEHSHFYLSWLNFNKGAVQLAKEKNLPVLALSDSHMPSQVGGAYTMVDASRDTQEIFTAIRNHKVQPVYKPLSILKFMKITFFVGRSVFIQTLHRLFGYLPSKAVRIYEKAYS